FRADYGAEPDVDRFDAVPVARSLSDPDVDANLAGLTDGASGIERAAIADHGHGNELRPESEQHPGYRDGFGERRACGNPIHFVDAVDGLDTREFPGESGRAASCRH